MIRIFACSAFVLLLSAASLAQSPSAAALPYAPSLDRTSMDKTIDPCVDFYTYSCGGWKTKNPIPPDQTIWAVYSKSYQDNYGNTGGTIGHELTHGFDDEGSQFDATGNLKDWWTKEDREKFDARTKCIDDQYSSYVSADDVHLNGKLTLDENVADLGGEILAFMAWQSKTKDMNLQPIDGLTPEQRFFIGFAQWDCSNERPDDLRVRANTDPHSSAKFRINGVVVNMPEFSKAFGCKPGQPMVRPPEQICKVW